MNKKLFKMLCLNFNRELDKDVYEIYEEALSKYDEYYIADAIKYIIEHDKFMPTIARIIEATRELPYRELTEEEKKARWEKEEIRPSWIDEEIDPEEATAEEIAEIDKLLKDIRG